MIQDLIRKSKEALIRKKTDFQAEESQLQAEEAILTRLASLEQRVADGETSFNRFKEDFGEFCRGQNIGEWFSGELPKMPGMGVDVYAALCAQVAAHDAAIVHQKEIVEGVRKALVAGPEGDLADYRKQNMVVLKKYAAAA
jgi:hypothetical protein